MGIDVIDILAYLLANPTLQVEVFLYILLVLLCDVILPITYLCQFLGQTSLDKVSVRLKVGY